MPEINHFQYNVTVGNIWVVVDANVQVPAFWAHPQSGGPFPGLVLLHDDWGLGKHLRAMAHRLAEVGYYVMVPDLFDGKTAATQLEADALEIRYLENAMIKVGASLQALETHHKCNSKMAVVGWDFGGYLAMRSAIERSDLMAAISFYGDATPVLDKLDKIQCPLLSIFGDEDPLTEKLHDRIVEVTAAASEVTEIIVYPGAAHGFYNDMRTTFAERAAEAAWHKVLEFLKTHQGEPPPPEEAAPGFFKPGRVY